MATKIERERDEAISELRKIMLPGDTLYTVLRHVSRSGMSRDIDVYLMTPNGLRYLSYWAAKATGNRMAPKGDGVRMGGCGMDMGFALVYSISRAVFPNGHVCIGDKCPSSDHCNHPRDTFTEHSDGGYALNHRWL
jgi:hypothetical protein